MGLFDGDPSAADLAQRFGVPVLAVVDASAMAGTFGALAFGLQHYRPGLPWAGVLANRVGSARHADMLQAGLREPQDWLGALMRVTLKGDVGAARAAGALLPERHLGLVAAHELGQDAALARLDAAADLLAATSLGALTLDDWRARWAVAFAAPAAGDADAVPPLLAGRTVAVARDAAFAFIYPANVATLQALGARVVFFSPLAGDALPECDALWLPGGYPELHAAALAARSDLRSALHRHAADGKPIWAECGGMMALFEELVTADGAAHAMWGLLPGRTTMQKKLAGLGMQAWAAAADAPPLRGHSFHYSVCDTPLAPVGRTTPAPGSARREGEAVYVGGPRGAVRGSYFHAWLASSPRAAVRLFSSGIGAGSACSKGDQP